MAPTTSETTRALRSHSNMPQATRTPQQLFYYLKDRILQANGPDYLEMEGIPPATGHLVARSLSEDGDVERKSVIMGYNSITQTFSVNMPNGLHNCCLSWATEQHKDAFMQGFFAPGEARHVRLCGTDRFDNFLPPYTASYKEPDAFIINPASGSPLPSIVTESGYSESVRKLYDHKDLWLQGGAPHVNVVILLKWYKRIRNRIAGWVELHRRGVGVPLRITLFPAPPSGTPPQHLTLFRSDLYPGGVVPAGRNANDAWEWSIDILREHARDAMRREGLVPV
ncbi:uncharacterized protein BO87DRAFT_437955 [Aspergillus neoniger CBS 115656]|uniref:Uncharacterized protein n=1 Tax=Aspergillus neoniger (strain CBS 115656) TaxID=1448310 RepID=A0A318YW55_ASPNB|nr:hypothetical protein BO87DRAFT_437955 [Aspergillus neoniger CBS 115656]PYH39101.1 hypothetical protein BO87DRAFT_437955 [Aspergillus neoniger CBS 115656]